MDHPPRLALLPLCRLMCPPPELFLCRSDSPSCLCPPLFGNWNPPLNPPIDGDDPCPIAGEKVDELETAGEGAVYEGDPNDPLSAALTEFLLPCPRGRFDADGDPPWGAKLLRP